MMRELRLLLAKEIRHVFELPAAFDPLVKGLKDSALALRAGETHVERPCLGACLGDELVQTARPLRTTTSAS